MKIYERSRSLQALLSSSPYSRVLARLASLAQTGELARRLLFVDLKGQIFKTHLKFLEVPFIKSRQKLNMYYTNPNYYDF